MADAALAEPMGVVQTPMTAFPILMYHALWPAIEDPSAQADHFARDPQLADPGARLYALDVRDFARQVSALSAARNGQAALADWDQLSADLRGAPPGRAAGWITFDDGHHSNADLALPVLKERGLWGIFFVTSDWIGRPGFMDEVQIRRLRAEGMLIGSHGCSHRYLSDLSAEELGRELEESKRRLEQIVGEPVKGVSLPGGRNHRLVGRLARRAGYEHVFTSRIGLARSNGDPMDWPRIPITNR